MWVRRGFFRWLLPAAAALPLWLFVGGAVFGAGALSFLGVFFVLAPAVLVGQLVLTLVIRLRPLVRADRAVSWWDVLVVTAWQGTVVALGCFMLASYGALVLVSVLVYVVALWSSTAQLMREWRAVAAAAQAPAADGHTGGVYVIHEAPRATSR